MKIHLTLSQILENTSSLKQNLIKTEKAITDLEKSLNDLAQDPKMIESMLLMQADIRAGNRAQYNARDYYHNIIIDRLFKQVRERAWDDIRYYPDVLPVIQQQESKEQAQAFKQFQSFNLNNMYK